MFGQINPPALLLFIRHAPKLPLILHLHAFDPFTPLRLTFDPTYMYILKVQGGFIGPRYTWGPIYESGWL